MEIRKQYIEAIGRNTGEEKQHSHLYEVTKDGYLPMCMYGWNRSDGFGFSIFRGWAGKRGTCKTCQRRADQNLSGIEPIKHKTKWL